MALVGGCDGGDGVSLGTDRCGGGLMRPLAVVLIWGWTLGRGEDAIGLEGGEDVGVEGGGEDGGVDERRMPVVVGHDKGESLRCRTGLPIVYPARRDGPQPHPF
jgi:hypothetical protein